MEKIIRSDKHILIFKMGKIELLEEYGTSYRPAGFISNIPDEIMTQLFAEKETVIKKTIKKQKKVTAKKTSRKDYFNCLKKTISKTNSILGLIKVESIEGNAVFSATNKDQYCIYKSDVVYNGNTFLACLDDIIIFTKDNNLSMTDGYMISGNLKKEINIFYDDFPDAMPIDNYDDNFLIDHSLLKKAITHSSTDTIKPVYNSVFISKDFYCSTDSRRLFLSGTTKDNNGTMMPYDTAKLIFKDAEIFINKKDNKAKIVIDESLVIYTRMIEGQFPNYKQVIPGSFQSHYKIDKLDFLEKMKTIKSFTSEPAYKVVFEIKENCFMLNAENSIVELNVDKYEMGTTECFGVNASFIIDALKIMDSDIIDFKFNGDMEPIVISDGKIQSIVMQIQIKEKEE